MGCDIHPHVEIRRDGRWQKATGDLFPGNDEGERDEPFPYRQYNLFGFLADVRNYSHSPVIAEPRGLPDDVSADVQAAHEWWDYNAHSASWLTLAELLAYDYERVFWDRRVTKNGNGAALADEGEGEHLTLREFLGEGYFERLSEMERLGNPTDVRVVFWFDD